MSKVKFFKPTALAQKGFALPVLLLLIAAAGIIGFLVISSSFSFQGGILSKLFPKQFSHAAGVVDLSLIPAAVTVSQGQTFLVDVAIDAKTTQPSAIQLQINYDPATLELDAFQPGLFFTTVLTPASINNGVATITLGQQPGNLKTGAGSVATLQFKALKTSVSSPVSIDSANTQVAAIGLSGDQKGILSNSAVTVSTVSQVTKSIDYSLSPSTGSATAGNDMPVQVRVKTSTDSANLFSAKINFDASKLSVTSIDTSGSFVTQWVSNTFDNSAGQIALIGGVPSPGYTGTTPTTMATIHFKPLTSGTGLVNFDGTSAAYRNSDNVDILSSTTGGTYTITGTLPTPTPSPTSTPTPSPSATPTPVPSPSVVPSPSASAAPSPSVVASTSPSPSASQIASASPSPSGSGGGNCIITAASWSTSANPVNEGTVVDLSVTGSSQCTGQSVSFQVLEDDSPLGTDPIKNQPPTVKFDSSNKALSSWIAEYQPDGVNGISDPPEYFFNAFVSGSQTAFTSTGNELLVNKLSSNQFLPGDGNHDGKVDLADLSVLLSNWNKNSGFPDEIDLNQPTGDGLINSFDFAEIVKILKTNGTVK